MRIAYYPLLAPSLLSFHQRHTALTILDYTTNKFTSLPSSLTCCTALKKLFADCNSISTLPANMSALSRLQLLSISQNALKSLPAELTTLRSLEKLLLSKNPDLSSIPPNLEVLARRGSKWTSGSVADDDTAAGSLREVP